MFGSGDPREDARRRAYRKSILDCVRDEAKGLEGRLSGRDRAKLEEYLDSVRGVERQIEQAERHRSEVSETLRPDGIPEAYAAHIRVMYDLMVLAFRSDVTRLSTFLLAHDGSNRSFPELGVGSGHHELSHHRNDPEKLEQIARIDRFYVEQFATFLQRLADTPEGDGNLLDHSMIVYGGGIADGNRHSHEDLPIHLAGGGNGTLSPGRIIEAPEDTPVTNLYLSLLDRIGAKVDRIGDSTGRLKGI